MTQLFGTKKELVGGARTISTDVTLAGHRDERSHAHAAPAVPAAVGAAPASAPVRVPGADRRCAGLCAGPRAGAGRALRRPPCRPACRRRRPPHRPARRRWRRPPCRPACQPRSSPRRPPWTSTMTAPRRRRRADGRRRAARHRLAARDRARRRTAAPRPPSDAAAHGLGAGARGARSRPTRWPTPGPIVPRRLTPRRRCRGSSLLSAPRRCGPHPRSARGRSWPASEDVSQLGARPLFDDTKLGWDTSPETTPAAPPLRSRRPARDLRARARCTSLGSRSWWLVLALSLILVLAVVAVVAATQLVTLAL